eukprot:250761_1
MWILITLSSLLLVVAHAVLDCKAIELLSPTNSLTVLPMDFCTTVTSDGVDSSFWYHCDDSGNVVVSSYQTANCEGSATTAELSGVYSDFTVTAYCDKPACEVVISETMMKPSCDAEATTTTATSIIAGFCTGQSSTSVKYTCDGDNVVVTTYSEASDCTGTSSVVSYAAGVIDCMSAGSMAMATKFTCSTASFTGPSAVITDAPTQTVTIVTDSPSVSAAIVTNAPSQPGAIVTDAPSTSDGIVTDAPSQTLTNAPTTSDSGDIQDPSGAVTIQMYNIFVFIVASLYVVM